MTLTRRTTDSAPGTADQTKHPMLWGHQLPRWTENGMAFAEGSHWQTKTFNALILWKGRCRDVLARTLADDDTVRGLAPDENTAAHRIRCRDHLHHVSSREGIAHRHHGALLEWVTWRWDLLLRLAQVDIVPKPPEVIIPGQLVQHHRTTRQERLDAKPTLDPELEGIF